MRLFKTVILMSWIPLTMGVAPFFLVWGHEWQNIAMWISGLVILSIGIGIPVLAMLITLAQDIYRNNGEGFEI